MSFAGPIKRFWCDRRGNFAMMTTLAIVPLIGAVGLAADFSMLSTMRANLQNANDAAVLYASRYYEEERRLPGSGDVSDFLAANYSMQTGTPNLYIKDGQIWLESDSNYEPYFMGLFSSRVEKVSVTSATPLSKEVDMEIVLALDTTKSMETDDKIGGLKTAAANFVDSILSAATDYNRIKVGLVPFSQYVNVGLHNRNAPWMSVPEDSSSVGEERCEMRTEVIGQTNCQMRTGYDDGVPYQYQSCDPIYGSRQEQVCWTPKSTTKWNGCVGSREAPLHLKDTDPDGDPEELFPGIMNAWCATPIAPLTKDKKALLDQIAAFRPNGDTYIVEGVMWGQRVLSPQLPFAEGVDPKDVSHEVRKIMVLMTDGENTRSADLPRPTHNGYDGAQSDAWTRNACREARDNGIEIFTITFGNDVPKAAKKIMEECAHSDKHYFDAASAGKLDDAFRTIAGYLTRIRLTH